MINPEDKFTFKEIKDLWREYNSPMYNSPMILCGRDKKDVRMSELKYRPGGVIMKSEIGFDFVRAMNFPDFIELQKGGLNC